MTDLRDEAAKRSRKRSRDESRQLCGAKTAKSGYTETCRAYAIVGGSVCNKHGGGAPQVREKARQRLLAATDWLMAELLRIAKRGDTDAVKLAAINSALNRAGISERHTVEVEAGATWEHALENVFGTSTDTPVDDGDWKARARRAERRLAELEGHEYDEDADYTAAVEPAPTRRAITDTDVIEPSAVYDQHGRVPPRPAPDPAWVNDLLQDPGTGR